MKKIMIGAIFSLFAFSAQAMQIVDVNNPYVFLKEGHSHTITHDFSDDGVPDQYQVTSGVLKLGFSDGYKHGDWALDMASLSGSGLSGVFEVDGTHKYGYDIKLFGLGADGLSDINTDGKIEVTLTAIHTPRWYQGYNDFWWKTSKLIAQVTPTQVSEPATFALFGFGLMGLVMTRRKAS